VFARYETHPGANGDVPQARVGSPVVAEVSGIVAGIHLHVGATQSSGRTFWAGAWDGRACSERVLPDRFQQSQGRRLGWSGGFVCRVSVRVGVAPTLARWCALGWGTRW